MKIYLSADIEGVCGITDWSEADRETEGYPEFRERMTAEVAAACEGALQAGATEILIKDAHATGRNILAEELPREARLVRGWSGHPFSMVQELDETFRAALFIGWHSAAGRGGNPLAHTLSSAKLAAVRVNGELASEFKLHAWAAALVSVPVVFVSGDDELCKEVHRFDERILTRSVTRGVGASTVALHPAEARDGIRTGVRLAVEGVDELEPSLPEHFSVEVVYKDQRNGLPRLFLPRREAGEPDLDRLREHGLVRGPAAPEVRALTDGRAPEAPPAPPATWRALGCVNPGDYDPGTYVTVMLSPGRFQPDTETISMSRSEVSERANSSTTTSSTPALAATISCGKVPPVGGAVPPSVSTRIGAPIRSADSFTDVPT